MTPRGQSGFTLLEVIVALAVFGFLLAGLSQTVRFGLLAWRQDNVLSNGKTDLEAVDRSLRAIVENFSPGDDSGNPSIDGTQTTLTALTSMRVPGSGLQPERIEAGIAVSRGRLVLRWRPYHHGEALVTPAPPAETELIGNVARLGIEYWQAPGVWVTRWRTPELPLLVRFRLTFAGEHPVHWPDIVAAPRLSAP